MSRADDESGDRPLNPLQHAVNAMLRLPIWISMIFRVQFFRLIGVRIGWNCWMHSISIPRNPWDIRIGRHCVLDRNVVLLAQGEHSPKKRIIIGDETYLNRFTTIDAIERVEVGKNCLIGPQVFITDYDHGQEKGVSMAVQPVISRPVIIEEGVWIGAGAIILKGVKIGRGAVVGAGAVVTQDVPAEAVVAGVPAERIGMRTGSEDWSQRPFISDI